MVYAEHPATHVMAALVGSVICSILILFNGYVRPGSGRVAPITLLHQTLYTALLAPLFVGALLQIRRVFAFQAPRRRV